MNKFGSYINSEWEELYKEKYNSLKYFPSSYILSHAAIFENNPEKFTLDYLSKISDGSTLSDEARKDLWNLHSEESSDLKYMPYTERYRVLKRTEGVFILERSRTSVKNEDLTPRFFSTRGRTIG